MTGGERRLAQRFESKLEEDWLIWYDVPLGPHNVHPDFIVFNPRRGLLVLEVKDWRLDTIQSIDRQNATLLTSTGIKRQVKPLLIKLPNIQAEADYIAKHLKQAHQTGTPWSDMAVIYRDYSIGKPVLATLRKAGIASRLVCCKLA